MDKTARDIRYAEWFARIQDCAQSGLSKAQYCKEHGIALKTFYYYQRRIRARLAEQLQQGIALPEGVEDSGLLAEPTVPRPQIVKLNLPEQGIIPQSYPAGMVNFSVNGMVLAVEESISPSFLAKLLKAAGNGSC